MKHSGCFTSCLLYMLLVWGEEISFAQSQADSLLRKIQSIPSDSSKAYHYLLLSNAYLEESDLDSSLWAARESRKLGEQQQLLSIIGWAQHMEGNYYYYSGAYDKAIALQSQVRKYSEEFRLTLLRACAQKMIAWIYLEMGKEREALSLFQESLGVFKVAGADDFQRNFGITYYGIATGYFFLKDFQRAKLYYDSAIRATPVMRPREMAFALADRAALMRDAFSQPRDALNDAMISWKIIEKQKRQEDAKAYVLSELSLSKAMLGDKIGAYKDAQQAFQIYESLPLTECYRSVYESLSRSFALADDYKMAYLTEQRKTVLMDSIYQWRKILSIEELQTRYETEKSKHQIDLLHQGKLQNELQNAKFRTALWVISGILITLVIGTIIYQVKREKYLLKIRHLEAEQKIQEEKERIKRDLHDSLGSQLSSIAMGLNREVIQSNNQNLIGLQELADKAISELRDSLWVLDKASISVEELEQRINTLFWQYQKLEMYLQMEFKREGGDQYFFSSKTASHLFRIIQEVLHNSVKHSECTKILIEMNFKHDSIKLSIKDNGKGIETPVSSGDHFGLINVQRRANQLNAQLAITSEPHKGTAVDIVLPIY